MLGGDEPPAAHERSHRGVEPVFVEPVARSPRRLPDETGSLSDAVVPKHVCFLRAVRRRASPPDGIRNARAGKVFRWIFRLPLARRVPRLPGRRLSPVALQNRTSVRTWSIRDGVADVGLMLATVSRPVTRGRPHRHPEARGTSTRRPAAAVRPVCQPLDALVSVATRTAVGTNAPNKPTHHSPSQPLSDQASGFADAGVPITSACPTRSVRVGRWQLPKKAPT